MRRVALFIVLALLVTAPALGQALWTVRPGESLGPLKIGMPVIAAKQALPETPSMFSYEERRGEDGIRESSGIIRWDRTVMAKPAEGDAPAQTQTFTVYARYAEDKITYIHTDDPRFLVAGKSVGELTIGEALAAFGTDVRLEPRSPFSVFLVYDAAGIALRASNWDSAKGWIIELITVFSPGTWDSI